MSWTRWAGLVLVGLALLFFLDSVRLTIGAAFVARRSGARLALLAVEAGGVGAWALARFALGVDRALLPEAGAGWAAIVGLALTAGGAALAVWAKLRLGRWFSMAFGVKPGHELITDGPYAITRHPMYTGVAAVLAGSALVWNSALTLGLAALFALCFGQHARHEEALFEEHFGDAFRAYRERVPRLAPFLPPARRAGRKA